MLVTRSADKWSHWDMDVTKERIDGDKSGRFSGRQRPFQAAARATVDTENFSLLVLTLNVP